MQNLGGGGGGQIRCIMRNVEEAYNHKRNEKLVIQRANQWFTAAQKLKTQHSTYYINQDAKRWWLTRVLND